MTPNQTFIQLHPMNGLASQIISSPAHWHFRGPAAGETPAETDVIWAHVCYTEGNPLGQVGSLLPDRQGETEYYHQNLDAIALLRYSRFVLR